MRRTDAEGSGDAEITPKEGDRDETEDGGEASIALDAEGSGSAGIAAEAGGSVNAGSTLTAGAQLVQRARSAGEGGLQVSPAASANAG